jgi:hypothetical protein
MFTFYSEHMKIENSSIDIHQNPFEKKMANKFLN